MGKQQVGNLYARLKDMAVEFRIKPGERLNEVALARELAVSRTPLRETLNRLVAEQFFVFRPGHGFYCRELDAQSVFALYEAREILESATVRLACIRASDTKIDKLKSGPFAASQNYDGKTIAAVVADDEAFHIAIAELSANAELVRQLHNINERIRFIRWIDMAARVLTTKDEHKRIVAAIKKRDADRAAERMQTHITRRMDQIVAAVKEGYSSIYLPDHAGIFSRPAEGDAITAENSNSSSKLQTAGGMKL